MRAKTWRNARYLNDRTTDSGQNPGRTGDLQKDPRTHGQRDRDRILYCSALRRLASVTQVTSPTASGSTHNRLTHALKVAQVGRRIAENLLRACSNLRPNKATDPASQISLPMGSPKRSQTKQRHPGLGAENQSRRTPEGNRQNGEAWKDQVQGFEGIHPSS